MSYEPTHPRIASNTPRDDTTMHVEYVMRDGRRCIIAVPMHRWLQEGHAPVKKALLQMYGELDAQAAARRGKVPSG